MSSISEKSRLGKDIAEKRRILRGMYGGHMKQSQLDKELGKSKGYGAKWARENGVCFIKVGANNMYDVDMVADALVRGRNL